MPMYREARPNGWKEKKVKKSKEKTASKASIRRFLIAAMAVAKEELKRQARRKK